MTEEFWNLLAAKYSLTIKEPPLRLDGGLLHRTYALRTNKGDYAVKLLNPSVMARETAMDNFAEAERLEALLAKKDIPVLPALTLAGKKMQEIEGQYFYLFTLFNGKALEEREVTEAHCRKMGITLAQIHALERQPAEVPEEMTDINWDFYLAETADKKPALHGLLKENIDLIKDCTEREKAALKNLPPVLTVCHNDFDRKNVLWQGRDYYIIDLECLAHGNPAKEFFTAALAWSGAEDCNIQYPLFRAFMDGYEKGGGVIPVDWGTLCNCCGGKLQWLEYSLKRALGIDCAESETHIGEKQAAETVKRLVYYCSIRDEIIQNIT